MTRAITGSCPKAGSGSFYVCEGTTTQFIGCCTIDPCADGTGDCPLEELGYTSFDADSYDDIPPQKCVSSGEWYTCKETTTAFMGCCKTNPCANDGCYGGNLTAAELSSNTTDSAPFLSSATSDDAGSSSSLSTGAKVGIAIGCAGAVLILAIVGFLLYRRRPRRGEANVQPAVHVQPQHDGKGGMYMPSPYQDSVGFPSPRSQFTEHFGMDQAPPYSPDHGYAQQRPASTAPSWLSTTTTGHGYGHGAHPSVSSMGSSQGGLHTLYNQHRSQQQFDQQLNTVSEMDSTPVVRELPGHPVDMEEQLPHERGNGYSQIEPENPH